MAYKDRNKLKSDLKRRYNISVAVYEAMMKGVDRRCMICNASEEEKDTLHIDHNHEDGKIRGVLCVDCNHGLAKFCDDPELLRKAAKYIEDDLSVG